MIYSRIILPVDCDLERHLCQGSVDEYDKPAGGGKSLALIRAWINKGSAVSMASHYLFYYRCDVQMLAICSSVYSLYPEHGSTRICVSFHFFCFFFLLQNQRSEYRRTVGMLRESLATPNSEFVFYLSERYLRTYPRGTSRYEVFFAKHSIHLLFTEVSGRKAIRVSTLCSKPCIQIDSNLASPTGIIITCSERKLVPTPNPCLENLQTVKRPRSTRKRTARLPRCLRID